MNKYMKMTRDGFTLVELMIVVAIIGVLASIAVPQYSKFQAKSRQSEVRIQLGAAYTVEQSFAAENSTYTSCLGQVGYNRDGTKFYYTIGFEDGVAAKTLCTPGDPTTGDCQFYQWSYTGGVYAGNPSSKCAAGTNSSAFPANIAEPNAVKGVTASKNLVDADAKLTTNITSAAFTIGAGGSVLKGGVIDGWTIDNNKQILNTQSGLVTN